MKIFYCRNIQEISKILYAYFLKIKIKYILKMYMYKLTNQ